LLIEVMVQSLCLGKITYSKSHFFELAHYRILLQATQNCRIKRLVWSNSINLNPRVTCKESAHYHLQGGNKTFNFYDFVTMTIH